MLTGNTEHDVAHIFPFSILKRPSDSDSLLNFWKTLKAYWSDDRIQEWQNAIFPNQNKGVETCCNLICLSPDAHAYWGKPYFALQPIELSADEKRLDVKLHWVPRRGRCTNVDILSPPPSLEGLDGIKLYHFPTNRQIFSGDLFSLTTDDPVNHPLPHYGLLEMQWILHRLAAMGGAADIYDDFDNDDDDPMVLRNEWDQYEENECDSYMEDDDWNSYREETPPVLVNEPSPPFSPSQPSVTSPKE